MSIEILPGVTIIRDMTQDAGKDRTEIQRGYICLWGLSGDI
jgi:hypothetical protein